MEELSEIFLSHFEADWMTRNPWMMAQILCVLTVIRPERPKKPQLHDESNVVRRLLTLSDGF